MPSIGHLDPQGQPCTGTPLEFIDRTEQFDLHNILNGLGKDGHRQNCTDPQTHHPMPPSHTSYLIISEFCTFINPPSSTHKQTVGFLSRTFVFRHAFLFQREHHARTPMAFSDF